MTPDHDASVDSAETDTKELLLMRNQVRRFHKRQSLSIFLALFLLLMVLIAMTGQHYIAHRDHEREMLVREFQERIIYLDHILSSVTNSVEGMRYFAQVDLIQSRHSAKVIQPVEFQYLQGDAHHQYFSLDTFSPPVTKEAIGNLTGLGSLAARDKDFHREIRMALGLNPIFRTTSQSLKNIAWVYYTSKKDFLNIYPWISSADFKFSKEVLSHEFFTLGTPERNPDRGIFWTQVYVDEYGKGLMTTCAAPVYDNDEFMGTVAVDLTVDFLNTIVSKFTIGKGVMCLINDRGQLLAHPNAVASKDRKVRMLEEVLPEGLKSSATALTRLPDKKIILVDSFNIYSDHLDQAPWQVIYYEKPPPVLVSLMESMGLGPLIVLGLLVLIVAVVFVITERQFISPSENFVNHIINRSQKFLAPPLNETRVPAVWKKWFNIIDTVFTDNEDLTKKVLKQNERLELEVKQRTEELLEEIDERKAAEAEKEKLIDELKNTLSEIKTLQGFIPICARCKKIRDDKGFWENLESYIEKNTDALFSHSLCQDCSDELYGDQTWYIKQKNPSE